MTSESWEQESQARNLHQCVAQATIRIAVEMAVIDPLYLAMQANGRCHCMKSVVAVPDSYAISGHEHHSK